MSNLVIGLIGVVLFAGILLYGGVALGPRIEDGLLSGSITALLTDMTHAANAVNRYRLGREVGAGTALGTLSGLVTSGHLSAVPVNPVAPAKSAELADAAGKTYAEYGVSGLDVTTFSPAFVVISLGTDNLACSWFARHAGEIARSASASTTSVAFTSGALAQAGCFRANYASGNIATGDYVAYVRI